MLLLLKFIITCVCLQADAFATHELKLDEFSIETRLRYIDTREPGDRNEVTNAFHEFYSSRQRRAAIFYETHSYSAGQRSGVFYLDKQVGTSVLDELTSSGRKTRSASCPDWFYLDLFQFQLDEGTPIPDHVVGPARLLYLVESYKTRLRFESIDPVNNEANFPSIKYQAEGRLAHSWGHFSMTVFYRQEPGHATAMPARVEISWPDKEIHDVLVEFSFLDKLLKLSLTSKSSQVAIGGGIVDDPFMYGPARGFSAALKDQSINLFGPIEHNRVIARFSFKTQIEYTDRKKPIRSTFVAYDSGLKLLRVDLGPRERKLLSLKHKRMFHLKHQNHMDTKDSPPAAHCAIAPIFPSANASAEFSLGHMLAKGDEFVYLGEAQVRGMLAKVYEISHTILPFWLESPLLMDQHSYTIVLYIEAHQDVPIHMRIFHESSSVEYNEEYASISIREFSWSLNGAALNGDRGDKLFSLAGECSGEKDESAKAEMLFTSSTAESSSAVELETVAKSGRNLALLAGIQWFLGVPAPIVYDLESRVLTSSGMTDKMLAVTFRVREHEQSSTRLQDLTGSQVEVESEGTYARVSSLEECFLLAAHRGPDEVFSYDRFYNECRTGVILKGLGSSSASEVSYLHTELSYFRVLKGEDPFSPLRVKLLVARSDVLNPTNIIGTRFQLFGLSPGADKSDNGIKQVVDLRLNQLNVQVLKHHFVTSDYSGLSEISGFSLVESDSHSIRVDTSASAMQQPRSEAPMTIARCKSLCMANLDCNLYSICTRYSSVECILSKLSIDFPDVANQIAQQSHKRLRFGARISLKLPGGQQDAELERRPNCELHSKNYLKGLFKGPTVVTFGYYKGSLVPAPKGREWCARECALHNVNLLRGQANKASQLGEMLVREMDDYEKKREVPQDGSSTLPRQTKMHACLRFYYFEVAKIPPDSGAELDRSVVGYCTFDRIKDRVDSQEEWRNLPVAELYKYKTDSLYEEHAGLALKETPKSDEEETAYLALKYESANALSMLAEMEAFLKRGGNTRVLVPMINKQGCATLCLQQISSPWPACKSFDIYLTHSHNSAQYTCQLNSITLHEAMSSAMGPELSLETAHMSAVSERKVWHYEPALDFALLDRNLLGELARRQGHNDGFLVQELARMTALIAGLAIGLLVGIMAGSRRANELSRRVSTLELVKDGSATKMSEAGSRMEVRRDMQPEVEGPSSWGKVCLEGEELM